MGLGLVNQTSSASKVSLCLEIMNGSTNIIGWADLNQLGQLGNWIVFVLNQTRFGQLNHLAFV